MKLSKIACSSLPILHGLCETVISGKRIARYSRRGNRSPHLCFKTVLASFPAHGSSVVRPWSLAPCWACDVHFGASPCRGIHPSLTGVLTAFPARLIPITCIPPSPRQHIRGLSPRRWLLGESLPVPYAVDTSSGLRTARGYSVPHLRLALHEGLHSSPGLGGGVSGSAGELPSP